MDSESISSVLNSPLDQGVTTAPPAVESTVSRQPEPKSEPKADPKTEASEAAEAKAEAKARDEAGRFAKAEAKAEQQATTDAEVKTDAKAEVKDPSIDGRNAALAAARERYRRAEAALREVQAKEQAKPKVSIFENEDEGIAQRIAEHSRPLKEANFHMSVKLAKLTYKDEYEKAEIAFLDAAETDPRLYDQLRAASDPGEFVMNLGMQLAELAPVNGNLVAYREKVTGELKTELAKSQEQIKGLTAQIEALTKAQKDIESIPRSLNRGSESTQRAVADPTDIKDIVRFTG